MLARQSLGFRSLPARAVVVRAEKKGFSAEDAKKADAVKLSKRGTVASRVGEISPKDAKAAQEYYSSVAAAQEQQLADRAAAEAGGSQEIPEAVSERMIKRVAIFSGIPLLIGLSFFPTFYLIKTQLHVDVPVWVVYIFSVFGFGGALGGISYGMLSTSFDPEREGSFSGWTEFKANLPVVLDRFRRK